MRFTVPQFIDYETPIVWIFTFKQFLYIGFGGIVCFIIYFSVSFSIFIVATVLIMGAVVSFAFLKVGGRPLSTMVLGMLKFGVSPKMYVWKKKDIPANFTEKTMAGSSSGDMEGEGPSLKIGKGRIKGLSMQVEARK